MLIAVAIIIFPTNYGIIRTQKHVKKTLFTEYFRGAMAMMSTKTFQKSNNLVFKKQKRTSKSQMNTI